MLRIILRRLAAALACFTLLIAISTTINAYGQTLQANHTVVWVYSAKTPYGVNDGKIAIVGDSQSVLVMTSAQALVHPKGVQVDPTCVLVSSIVYYANGKTLAMTAETGFESHNPPPPYPDTIVGVKASAYCSDLVPLTSDIKAAPMSHVAVTGLLTDSMEGPSKVNLTYRGSTLVGIRSSQDFVDRYDHKVEVTVSASVAYTLPKFDHASHPYWTGTLAIDDPILGGRLILSKIVIIASNSQQSVVSFYANMSRKGHCGTVTVSWFFT